jgi:PAS domain S-box-containing protein
MPKPLNILILEDNLADAELLLNKLRRVGFEPTWQIVDNEKDFTAHLKPELDVIISDYSLPQFTGLQALILKNESEYDIPFIIVSGAIGEDLAVECMRAGADDYLFKDRLGRLGAAVDNAVKKKELRDEKRQARQDIEMLLALSRQAGAETSLDELLFFIANQIVEVVPQAEAASIYLYDGERKVIKVQAWAGFKDSEIKGLEFSIDGNLAGKIFQFKKPTLINDVSEDPNFELIDKSSLSKVKTQIAVPLIIKKRVVGIIFADNLSRTNAFSQKNLDLLESIGNQLAGVIENARLLDQVSEKHKQLRQIKEQYRSVVDDSPGLIDRFLPDGTITFVNQECCRFFGKTYTELIGTNIQSSIPEEDRESVMSNIASLTEESPIQTFENKVIRHDGEGKSAFNLSVKT